MGESNKPLTSKYPGKNRPRTMLFLLGNFKEPPKMKTTSAEILITITESCMRGYIMLALLPNLGVKILSKSAARVVNSTEIRMSFCLRISDLIFTV